MSRAPAVLRWCSHPRRRTLVHATNRQWRAAPRGRRRLLGQAGPGSARTVRTSPAASACPTLDSALVQGLCTFSPRVAQLQNVPQGAGKGGLSEQGGAAAGSRRRSPACRQGRQRTVGPPQAHAGGSSTPRGGDKQGNMARGCKAPDCPERRYLGGSRS